MLFLFPFYIKQVWHWYTRVFMAIFRASFKQLKATIKLREVTFGDHPFSSHAKFSEKLTFLTPWCAHIPSWKSKTNIFTIQTWLMQRIGSHIAKFYACFRGHSKTFPWPLAGMWVPLHHLSSKNNSLFRK